MTDTALAIVSTWIVIINSMVCGVLGLMAVWFAWLCLGWLGKTLWRGIQCIPRVIKEMVSLPVWIYHQRQ